MTSKAHRETRKTARNVATRQIRYAYVSARKEVHFTIHNVAFERRLSSAFVEATFGVWKTVRRAASRHRRRRVKCASAHPRVVSRLFPSSFKTSSSSSRETRESRKVARSRLRRRRSKTTTGAAFWTTTTTRRCGASLCRRRRRRESRRVSLKDENRLRRRRWSGNVRNTDEDEERRRVDESARAVDESVETWRMRLSVTTMLKARRRTTTSDETDERNRSRFVVAYKTLPIGARKKMFKDAETYFEERFVSSSTVVAGRGEDDGEDDGSRGVDDVKNRKSSGTPTTAQTLLFSSEHVKQLEAFGFVVLDDVVPEQAVRQMYEQCESLADKLFPVNQEGRDDDLASIKIDIENPTASPLNVAGTFLWSLPRKLSVSSSSSISPPKCALAARRTRRKHRVPKVCATREVRQTRRSIRPARGLRSEQRGRPGRLSHLRTKLNRSFYTSTSDTKPKPKGACACF